MGGVGGGVRRARRAAFFFTQLPKLGGAGMKRYVVVVGDADANQEREPSRAVRAGTEVPLHRYWVPSGHLMVVDGSDPIQAVMAVPRTSEGHVVAGRVRVWARQRRTPGRTCLYSGRSSNFDAAMRPSNDRSKRVWRKAFALGDTMYLETTFAPDADARLCAEKTIVAHRVAVSVREAGT